MNDLSWPPSVLMMETETLKYHMVLGYLNKDRVLIPSPAPFLLPQRVLRHGLIQSV